MKFAAFAAALVLSASAAFAATPTVTIDSGALAGASDGTVDTYKGIPYAAPPVGALRWMPPAPAAHWPGRRDATAFGAICPQPKRPDRLADGEDPVQSEDCLFLNVTVPHGARHAPVMVWIHGGAHRFGSGSMPIYDAANFAHDGVIVVSINYRLGLLGYFAHPALTKAAAPDAPLGNYGQMDQIAALQWVQRNIASFGGDPGNVTVFGESAGGSSILHLLATPSAQGLFARAIVESGGGWALPTTLAGKEAEGTAFAAKAGYPDATLAQLRAIPAEKTLDVPATLGFGPFVDGRLIAETPQRAFALGHNLQVPLMIGSNDFEASLMQSFAIPDARFLERLTPEARALYPEAKDDHALAQLVFTDSVMGAPAHWVAGRMAAHAPVYLYHFSYVAHALRGFMPGASHAAEIPFVFANGVPVAARFGITLTEQDLKMQTLVHSCWAGFAINGKPGCADWQAFTPANDAAMEFGIGQSGMVTGLHAQRYQAIEAILSPR